MRIIYRNIEAERARLGLNADEFSAKLGISRRAYYSKLRGINDFTASEITTIRDLTGQTADYLLEVKHADIEENSN